MLLRFRSKSQILGLWMTYQLSVIFVVAFIARTVPALVLHDRTDSQFRLGRHVLQIHITNDDGALDPFERDLIAAFGENDRDEAVINAAYAAFSRDLQNVGEIDEWGKWNEDIQEGDFFISEQEASQFYSETMDDLTKIGHDLEDFQVDVPDDEKQMVDEVIAAANRAMESIWNSQGKGTD
jgi:hypothetical protein